MEDKINNPLPDPVPGRREEPEFPITDGEDHREEGREWRIAVSPDYPDSLDLRDAREDDFDVRVPENDDFDLV